LETLISEVVLQMENVRILVCNDLVLLFEAPKPRKSSLVSFEAPESVAREMFVASMAHQAREPLGHVFDSMPFHLKMIEYF
jgi:hypothetical protein